MITIELESGRTYGVLFEVTQGTAQAVLLRGIEADTALALRPGLGSTTLEIQEGVLVIPASLTDTLSYVQLSAGGAIFGCRVIAPPEKEKTLIAQNLLDNSDFAFPVNQRGKSSYSGLAYTIDRWKSVSANGILRIEDGYVHFARGTGGKGYFIQYLSETDRSYYGRTYTFALCMTDGTVHTVTATFPQEKPVSGYRIAGQKIPGGEIGIHARSNRPSPYVQINVDAVDTPLQVRWAAVYEGDMGPEELPDYLPKGYAAEWAECARYYTRIGQTVAYAQPYYDVTEHFAPMRVAPTASIVSESGAEGMISVYASDGTLTDTQAILAPMGNAGVRVMGYGGAGSYAYAYIELSAEL